MTPKEGFDDYLDYHRCLPKSHLPWPEQLRAPPKAASAAFKVAAASRR